MALTGAPIVKPSDLQELIQQGLLQEQEDDLVEVNADEHEVYVLMGTLSTQWRTDQGVRTGLDYQAVEVSSKVLNMELDAEKWALFQLLEAYVISAYNTGLSLQMEEARQQAKFDARNANRRSG